MAIKVDRNPFHSSTFDPNKKFGITVTTPPPSFDQEGRVRVKDVTPQGFVDATSPGVAEPFTPDGSDPE